ncbi:MAG: UDP-N-acetylmuramoyl-L-alanyl-D-glutamate--2,6-diaminopimelate ligase [Legionellaceae bacterium]|nr:UDP-N-acetylmuramoyl-L-alanyl-D-glutamate--2,6-diaminopimelate ligase [Legionellaceae bacterium]
MKLSELLSPWFSTPISNGDISGLHNDSRQIKPGYLFIAYPGAVTDGRLYIQQAVQLGAAAIVYDPEQLPTSVQLPTIPCIPLPQLSSLLAAIANRFYENPSSGMSITGVTGTNGKTTIAYQLAQAYGLLDTPATYIGTIGQGDVHHLKPLMNTTPDALCLQQLLHDYKQEGIKQVCMEVSSHALSEHRVDSIDFSQAIFTNLSHEHLDYHHTMDAYADAKAMLFAMPMLKWMILNHDDPYAIRMSSIHSKECQKLTYGLQPGCDVRAIHCQYSMRGSEFEVTSPWGTRQVRVKSIGAFNIYNSLAVYSSLLAQGYAIDDVVSVMAQLNPSPGRMEVVSQQPYVLVDYAHTPDALENVLTTLVRLKSQDTLLKRIWVIFGCGGDRDATKRPIMGRIASQFADFVIISSDNPRTEEPSQIVDDIARGLLPDTNVTTILDRKEAIHYVLNHADKQDIILIAGKGHEAYQQIGRERFAFSDQGVVNRYKQSMKQTKYHSGENDA